MEDQSYDRESTNNATSEVGCNPVPQRSSDDEKWRLLLEQQNHNFLALVQAMKGRLAANQELRLPEFDPDEGNVDARAWISTADMCIQDPELQGAPLMLALSRALKGQASAWLAQVSFHGMCWSDFKDLFISRYDCPETAAAHLINLLGTKPKEGECLSAYAATMITSLMSKWKNLTVEQIAVSTIMAHISQFEPRVQRMSFTHDITNRSRLQQELKAVSFLKRRTNITASDNPPDAKRSREMPRCYTCGKTGHKAIQCRHRCDFMRQNNRMSTSSSESQRGTSQHKVIPAKPPVTCFHCQGVGHYASECPKRRSFNTGGNNSVEASSSRPITEKRVDVCTVSAPAGKLRHNGEQYPFYYDSGAECSLIKESTASKFSGKRFSNVVTMTGIGQTSVNSTVQILTIVEIDEMTLEILFHVLPDSYLHHDIMLGRELLGLGLSVRITSEKV